jgi:hypothetical protein
MLAASSGLTGRVRLSSTALPLAFVIPPEAHALATLARWTEPWRQTFNSSVVISTGVLYAHVTSLVCAGGLSLSADRASLLPGARGDAAGEHEARALSANRRLVQRALAVVVLSGLLLFLSDVETFVGLRRFWLKMGLIVLMITNSLLAQRCERRRRSVGPLTAQGKPEARSRHRVHAGVSMALWLLTLLAGTALVSG